METETIMHIGRKIEKIRTLKGIKQETLAGLMGVTQGTVSKIEQSEIVEDDKLQQIAKALGISADTIKNFNEEAAINLFNHISNNQFDNHSTAMVYQQYINPVEKIVELYERMLEVERGKVKMLEELLQKK